MTILAGKMKLFKGFEQEYKKRHDEIWPQLKQLLQESGITEYYIFLDEATLDLFAVLKTNNAAATSELADHPVMKKWWHYMKDIMETNPDESPVNIPLKEVFRL